MSPLGYFICKPHADQLIDFCADASRYLRLFSPHTPETVELQIKEALLRDTLKERGVEPARFTAAKERLMNDYREMAMATVVNTGEQMKPLVQRVGESASAFAAVMREGLTGTKVKDKAISKHIEKLEEMAAESAHWLTTEAQKLNMPFTRICRTI